MSLTIRMNATGITLSNPEKGKLHFKAQTKTVQNKVLVKDGDHYKVVRNRIENEHVEHKFPNKEWASACAAVKAMLFPEKGA